MDGNGNGHYGVPTGGLSAWAQADGSGPPVARLDAGQDVELVERSGDWARVICTNGWAGWVDGRLLVSKAMSATVTAPATLPPSVEPPTVTAFGGAPAAFTAPPAAAFSPVGDTIAAPLPQAPPLPTYAPPQQPPPPPDVPPGPRRKPPWSTGRGRLIIALIVAAAVVAVALLAGGGGKASAGEIFLKPADQPGANTFAPSIATPVAGSNGPNATTSPEVSSGGLIRANAAAPGLYSGVRGAPNCDGPKLAGYLEGNPSRGAPWAKAQGIQQNQIKPFISGLTPASLRVDTRVTDYQFSGGRAIAKPAILQAGTAVLLDREAIPRVRCQSGDPLGPARAVSDTPSYNGPKWSGFSPGTTVVLDPAPGTTVIVLVDPRTGLPFARVLGSVIVIDFDRPAAGATVIVVEPGGPFTVAGTRFPPGSAITVTWDNPAVVLATPTADGGGNFAITVNAPATAAVGQHAVNITGGGLSVIQTVYVIPPVPR